MLKSVFEKLGFDTICCMDKAANEAKEFVKECAEEENYKDCDCIVVVMSCFSKSGLVFPNGGTPFCQEKPKLFLSMLAADSKRHCLF